jgi:hypothetical protein
VTGTRLSRPAIAVALASVAVAAAGVDALIRPNAAAFAYLAAFSFVATTALGGLSMLMIAHATGAGWFVVLRRLCEAISGSLVLLPLLFAPIACVLPFLYPWARPFSGFDESLRTALIHSAGWMNPALFLLRALFYMLLWIGLGELLRRASLAEDRGGSEGQRRWQLAVSAAGLPIVLFSASFAGFDWVMSAVPGWNFNILGLYLLSGGFAAALGMLSLATFLARRRKVLPAELGPAHATALGRLLLTSICLWGYLAASQLVVVWSANLPIEAGFYLARFEGSFRILALALILGHFAVPFLVLVGYPAKRSFALLAAVGGWLVLMHGVDVYWLLMPAAPGSRGPVDLVPFLALSALLFAFGLLRFSRAPATPLEAEQLERSLAYEPP